ncbi:MAG: hypothetical protein Q7T55_05045 [Solirubrobacteraceae bacterium]|nr:hypothetical protein [Solirubrobacteraceae bacterium]
MQGTVPAPSAATHRSGVDERVPVVRALRVGGPEHQVTQAEVKAVATERFPEVVRSEGMLAVFDHAEIDTRRLARPLDWYVQPRTFAEKNAVYVSEALALSERLATEAMADAGITAAEVDAVVFVSSTGLSTPSLEASIIQDLGIDPSTVRLPLWGLGCAGGGAGLARGGDLIRAGYEHVLLIAVEFCSLTFVLGDEAKSNFIGTALFADGGSAVVLGCSEGDGDGGLARLKHAHSALIPGTAGLTGWNITEDGLNLRLSPEIPAVMMTHLRPIVDDALATAEISLRELEHVVIHPGGAKVITGYEAALDLGAHVLDPARAVLRANGNMSSPTVLFVLAETLKAKPQGLGLLSATGPGFSVEHVLLDFS